jgi:hypothetical protein
LLTAAPHFASLPARPTSRIARFLVPTPSRKAKSLRLSRLTGPDGLTEFGSVESLLVAVGREFEIACPRRSLHASRRLLILLRMQSELSGHVNLSEQARTGCCLSASEIRYASKMCRLEQLQRPVFAVALISRVLASAKDLGGNRIGIPPRSIYAKRPSSSDFLEIIGPDGLLIPH